MIRTPFEFWSALLAYCFAMGASVTSYGRTNAHNLKVGGVAGSSHRAWMGADVVYDLASPADARVAYGAKLGLRVIVESDHDHLQPLEWAKG